MNILKILAIGDVVGPNGVSYLKRNLWKIRGLYKIDAVIANGENSAEPNGIDKESATSLFESGVDVITTGNHVYRKSSAFKLLDDEDRIVRPLNYPSENPGKGDTVITVNGYKMLVLNVLGQAFMDATSCPFTAVEKALLANRGRYDFAVLDIHAEATGEKLALTSYFAESLAAALGTHTHVQTNDARVVNGCACITDLGMCGAYDSILGCKKEPVIHKMKTKMLSKFDFADGETLFNGAIFEIDTDTGCAISCEAIKILGDLV
jgi:metallophosphoesterase (TIGR00282 family)